MLEAWEENGSNWGCLGGDVAEQKRSAGAHPWSWAGRGKKTPSGFWINKQQKSRKGNNGNHWEIELIQGHLCK